MNHLFNYVVARRAEALDINDPLSHLTVMYHMKVSARLSSWTEETQQRARHADVLDRHGWADNTRTPRAVTGNQTDRPDSIDKTSQGKKQL